MQIILNGQSCDIPLCSLQALKKNYIEEHTLYENREVVSIVNGFQTSEDLPLSPGDEVFFIPKGVYPPKDALKSMLYARHTPHVQEQLDRGQVAVAGLGGLGSNIAIMLARCGVGHLHLIDFDVVEPSNLNRQQYSIPHLGMKKTDAMAQILSDINPYITVTLSDCRVTEDNLSTLFASDTIICEAFDVPQNKAMLVNGILTGFSDKILVSASGMAGFGDSNLIHTRKVRDRLYLCGDETTAARPGEGLMAPRVTICAAHQANLVLNLLVDGALSDTH